MSTNPSAKMRDLIADPDTGEVCVVGDKVEVQPPEVLPVKQRQRYAQLNKNFVMQNDGLGSLVRSGATGHDLFWLFALMAEAQKQGKRKITFSSDYAVLKQFGLPTDSRERAALRRAFRFWRGHGFDFQRWFHAEETRRIGHMERLAKARLKRQRKAAQTRPRSFKRVWKTRQWLFITPSQTVDVARSRERTIEFTERFWKDNDLKKFFCRAQLDVALKARYPHVILLSLLIDAKSGLIEWYPETLARKIGLREQKPGRRRDSIKRAVNAIVDITGQRIRFSVFEGGKIHIKRVDYVKPDDENPLERVPQLAHRLATEFD